MTTENQTYNEASAPRLWDGLLVAGLLALGIGQLVTAGPFGPAAGWTVVRMLALLALPWRRRYPIAMIGLGFGLGSIGALGQLATQGIAEPPDVTAALLLLPHALGRWVEGRRLGVGVGLAAVLVGVSLVAEGLTAAEMAMAVGILSIPLAIGVSSRLRARIRIQALEQAQLDERHRLGRQLDDVVAHRLAAIIIRAQTATAPEHETASGVEALRDIEREASQCLAEMRDLVRLLRRGEDERAPHTTRSRPTPQDELQAPAPRAKERP